jgi:dipeptidyl aminopeptidase/acylaminoacyl peptidase
MSLRSAVVVLLLPAAMALTPAQAHAACTIPLPGQDESAGTDEDVCGAVDLSPPPAGSGGPPPPPKLVAWASGFDVNPFNGARGGIWIARLDGSARRQLTTFTNHNRDFEPHGLNFPDDHPSFSPDNRRVVFTSNRAGGSDWDIYRMNVNGSGVVRVNAAAGLDTEPVFSPDGSKIAFATARFGDLDIAVMNSDGTNVQRLTTSASEDIEPAWSPDGSTIAFARLLGDDEKDIFVMNADGSDPRRVTFTAGEDHDPTWSPDGQRLVITSERPPFSPPFGNVHRIRVSDGADLGDLTGHLANGAGDPFWSRDGSVIAFFKAALPILGPMELHVMPAGGNASFHVPGEGSVNVHPAVGNSIDDDADGTPNYLESGSVGSARLAPRTLRAGDTRVVRFSWTHPARWRRLHTLYLSLASDDRPLGVVRHVVPDRSFSLLDLSTRRYGRGRLAGTRLLHERGLALDLRRTRIVNVDRRTLRLDLALRVARSHAGRWRVGVQALGAEGGNQAERLGMLRVARPRTG